MGKCILLRFLTFVIIISYVCYGAEELENSCLTSAYQDHGYQHISIQQQLQDYRDIYDEILAINPTNPYHAHSSRLFNKLQNAFQLVQKYIQDTEVFNPDWTKRDQSTYLAYLETLYKAACKMNEDREMTPLYFERINALCALIGTVYRRYKGSGSFYIEQTADLWKDEEKSLQEGIETTVSFIKKGMDESFIGRFDEILRDPEVKGFLPMAIIYMDRNVPIGYATFNDQLFKGSYPLFIGAFFPSPVPTAPDEAASRKKTKKEPHFSATISLFTMLAHDFEHRYGMLDFILWNIQKFGMPSYIEGLHPAYDIIDHETTSKNQRSVLHAGFFLLTHDNQFLWINFKKLDQLQPSNPFDFLKFIVNNYRDHIESELGNRSEDKYKKIYRDLEYTLYWAKNKKGSPFIPLIRVEGQDRFLPIARNATGIPVIFLEANAWSVKIRRADQTEISEVPYEGDSENNMILPEGWAWMPHEEQKQSGIRLPFMATEESFRLLNQGSDLYFIEEEEPDVQHTPAIKLEENGRYSLFVRNQEGLVSKALDAMELGIDIKALGNLWDKKQGGRQIFLHYNTQLCQNPLYKSIFKHHTRPELSDDDKMHLFTIHEAIKVSYEARHQKKLELYNLRQSYAALYIKQGFEDFWDEFKEIAALAYS